MKRLILFCMIILFLASIYGLCENGQIDINTASAEELDELYGIGPIKADAIIDARPFSSVDELIKVSGIGEFYLEKIIEQGLACVQDEKDIKEEIKNKGEEIINDTIEKSKNKEDLFSGNSGGGDSVSLTPDVIKLNPSTPKDIKSEDNKKLNRDSYAKYGFVAFCILLGVLFILKNRRKQKYENI